MARGRRGGLLTRSVVARGVARQSLWLASADSTAIAVLGAGLTVLDQAFTAAALDAFSPFTIVRTRGYIICRSDQVTGTEDPFGALGFAVVSEQARAAGAASLPAPITHEDSDLWFVHQFFFANVTLATATGIRDTARVYEFDSRAMRKVEDGEAIVVMVENANASHGISYILKFRQLIKVS